MTALLWFLCGAVLGKMLHRTRRPKARFVSRDPALDAHYAKRRQAEYDAMCARPFMCVPQEPPRVPYDILAPYRPKLEA